MSEIFLWASRHSMVYFIALNFFATFFWLLRFQKSLRIGVKEALLIPIVHTTISLIGTRLLALVEVGFVVEKAAGMRMFGGIFVLPFVYYPWAKRTNRKVPLVMDVAAVNTAMGAAFGRLNCILSGCCQGYPIPFMPDVCWPIREVEILFNLAFTVFFAIKILKRKTWGQLFSLYFMSYGALRFLSEFVRVEFTTQVGFLHLAHIWSLISIATGIVMYIKVVNNHKNVDKKSGKTR